MSYKMNLHQPIMSEEMKKELFSEDSLRKLVNGLKNNKEENEKMTEIDKYTASAIVPVEIDVNGTKIKTRGTIYMEDMKEFYEYMKELEVEDAKPDLKSYRLKMTQNDEDLLKLEWRSYDFSEGRRGFKLDEGIVFITLNKDEHFKGIASGEHLALVENDKLLKHVREMTQVFIGNGYDEHDEMEIVKKVVC